MSQESRNKRAIFGGGGYAGGITYSTPAFAMGAYSNAAPNGGFNFDLPLATVQSFTSQALAFSKANSDTNRGFLGAVYGASSANVNQSVNRAFDFGDKGINAIVSLGQEQQRQLTNRSDSGGCYISTAICEADQLPDDCEPLTVLRQFRDGPLAEMRDGPALVTLYYETAPAIVEKINTLPNRAAVLHLLRDGYMYPAIRHIKNGEYQAARDVYVKMVNVAKAIAEA